MRFGLVHRVMTDALAVLGILAVVSTSTLSPWATTLLLVGLAGALAVPESWQTKALFRHAATTGMIVLFVVQGARIVAGQPVIDVMVEFAALLQIIRLATRRGAAHDQQIIVLSLLHFVAGTVLGGGLGYGLCFLGFLVVAPGALVLSHLRREVEGNYRQGARDRTGLPVDVPRILRSRRVVGRGFLVSTCLISVPIFVFTALLFLLFPRVGLSLLLLHQPHPGRMVGFTDHVKIDEVGLIRSNPQMALRFELDKPPDPAPSRMILRLRGTAFDSTDGVNWTRTLTDRSDFGSDRIGDAKYRLRRMPHPGDKKITFDVEPIDPPVIFLPTRTVAVDVIAQNQSLLSDPLKLQRGPEGEIRYAGGDARGIRYVAYLAPDDEPMVDALSTSERGRYLSVPTLPARIAKLAHQWSDGETSPWYKAHAIESHLRHDFKYDLNSPSGGAAVPLDDFLFESKRGHCEFFSTAMAIMLREIGIPSRNVTGFVGGTYNHFGHYYAVREGEAHSWVEAYIDDAQHPGWITFDPTPSAGAQPLGDTTGAWVYMRDLLEAVSQRWNHYVIGYDLRSQVHIWDWFHSGRGHGGRTSRWRWAEIGGGATALLAFYMLWRRRRRSPKDAKPTQRSDRGQLVAASMYRVLEQALVTHGLTRPPSLPPLRFAEELRHRGHPLAAEVIDLTEMYLSVRFGGTKLSEESLRGFDKRVRAVRAWRRPREALAAT
ncbi:MAG TPA: transglutaminaseTgpA domain-containing protein [Polyangiaceae bacterium]|jgi:transglutaminase-like putative cysteine protease